MYKSNEKSLQKFTENKRGIAETGQKGKLTPEEIGEKWNRLIVAKGAEYHTLFEELEGYLSSESKNALWMKNDFAIKEEILRYIKISGNNGLPSAFAISMKTNLSRVTVTRHLKTLFNNDLSLIQKKSA